MSLSQNYDNNPTIIKYKFIKFDSNAGTKLLVSKNIQYFSECTLFSRELLPSQIKTIRKAMNEWEKVTNVKFVYEENNPKLFISATDLNYFILDKTREVLGSGWEINFKEQQVLFIDYKAGFENQESSMWLLLHELGHVPFLLEHISEYPAHLRVSDNSLASVMSYNHIKNSANKIIYPVTPSHFDISLVQQKFGINKVSTSGDNMYKFSSETYGHYTLYDHAGNDTIDLSNFNENLNINLNSGNLNKVSNSFSFLIYNTSIIENIITGSGNDIIYGNETSNKINAGSGTNIIYGGLGADYFVFNKINKSINTIKDFALKEDKIILEDFSLNCSDLARIIIKNHYSTIIKPDHYTTIEIMGNFDLLTCDNFVF